MKIKNKILLVLSFIFLLLICLAFSFNHNNDYNQISEAIVNGKIDEFSDFFSSNVEIEILDSKSLCSKIQAKTLLEEFFKQYKPTSKIYESNSNYTSGYFTTLKGDNYKFHYTLKNINHKTLITYFSVY
ncbi:MAG: DUF4783 domain-containing protein [Bacteroidales bacterium]|nr:DUF4783 domain-containing protein [Bacteroidales bacterium]